MKIPSDVDALDNIYWHFKVSWENTFMKMKLSSRKKHPKIDVGKQKNWLLEIEDVLPFGYFFRQNISLKLDANKG